MSAVAEFRLIPKKKLNDLLESAKIKKNWLGKPIDKYYVFLDSNSKKLKQYNLSGYYYADLLFYLSEKENIDLMDSEFDNISKSLTQLRGVSSFIFTEQHKEKYYDNLNEKKYSEQELQKFSNELHEEDDQEAGRAIIEALEVLKANILEASEDNVVLLQVG